MGVYKNGKKLGQPYFNGKKMNAYLNGKKVWSGGFPENVVVFQSDEPRTITPKYTNSGITLQYSVNGGASWVNITSGATTPSSKEIWMRGQATGTKSLYTSSDNTNAWTFSGDESNQLKVFGNLNFLLCDNLGDTAAPTTLVDYCYSRMFLNCTSLLQAPELPATTLADRCYQYIFRNCTSLAQAPELPATTLATYCYYGMFFGCTLLTQAPELPATTLADSCYSFMFYSCSALTSIVLHYPGNEGGQFTYWVNGISTTGTLYKAGTQFTASGISTYPATWTQVQI